MKDTDKILKQIGLSRVMTTAPTSVTHDGKIIFKEYRIPDKRTAQQKEMDDVYRISDLNLMHIETGLRLTYMISEGYLGPDEYKFVSMYIIDSSNKQLEVKDVDFKKKIFHTPALNISFEDTNKKT